MLSLRSRFDLTPNRLSLLLARLRAAGAPVIDLTESNPTRCGFGNPEASALEALADPRGLAYDPSPRGRRDAREAVAAYYAERGAQVDAEHIVLTTSTSEAYAYLLKLLADDGDDALVPQPSYPLFEFLAGLEGVVLRGYRLDYEGGWRIDLDSVRAGLAGRARAVLTVSPNNPTGSFLAASELAALDELAGEHGVGLVVDEVFADYPFVPARPPRLAVAGAERAVTFSLSGLSKLCGMPQLKLGWIAVAGPRGPVEEALTRLELIADTYLSVATPVQLALPRLLAAGVAFRRECLERVRANRAHLAASVAALPSIRLLEADGGWYACLRVPRLAGEEELCLELLERDLVHVHPGYLFDFAEEAYLVLSLIVAPERFAEAVARLLARLAARS